MQMEKYAKQAIAEGIRNRNEIFVNAESEIYKQLNQHYNRNNVIEVGEKTHHLVNSWFKLSSIYWEAHSIKLNVRTLSANLDSNSGVRN